MCCPRIPARKSLQKAPVAPPSPVASQDDKRAALKHYALLNQSLADLQHRLQGRSSSFDDIETLLATSTKHLAGLSEYISATIEPKYYNEIVPAGSRATQRTFAVPELFEMITEHLTIPSILALSQTCREYKARIDNSQHLQTTLRLRAAPPTSHLRLPWSIDLPMDADDKRFFCKPRTALRRSIRFSDTGGVTLDIAASFSLEGDEQHLPRIGSTYRRMFVTQPPVKELAPEIRCCKRVAQTPVVREGGIRIGDLYDIAAEFVEEHRWCVRESRIYHMLRNGQISLEFKGTIPLHPTDPLLKAYAKEAETQGRDDKLRSWVRRRNKEFRAAKESAHAQERPILTMPNWLEANPEWKTQDGEREKEKETEAIMADTAANGPVTVPIDAFSFD